MEARHHVDDEPTEEGWPVSHSPTRVAASALLGVTATACLVATPAPVETDEAAKHEAAKHEAAKHEAARSLIEAKKPETRSRRLEKVLADLAG